MKDKTLRELYFQNGEILNLIPIFLPRRFGRAGHRLKLHPDDYYACGLERGTIKERWFSSVIVAQNGESAAADEGLSVVNQEVIPGKVYLKDFVEELGEELLGKRLWREYGTWPMYSKFFDYSGPLFHHLHLDFESALAVGKLGKPEAYYYPPQLNNYPGNFPHTYFGFTPSVTKAEVRERLAEWDKGDTRITELSQAFRIQLGTGWYTPPGVLHAPGSYLTYEPQWNSDVNSVFENVTDGEENPREMLVENCPQNKKFDPEYIMSLLDWEENVLPDYKSKYFRPPVIASRADGYIEKWIAYGNPFIAAKELTVFPGCEAVIQDPTPYGLIAVQGNGTLNGHRIETPILLRFGQKSQDEYFVGYGAASRGVRIVNTEKYDPLVLLKHFPGYPDVPQAGNSD